MKKQLFLLIFIVFIGSHLSAQDKSEKLPVYANFSIGYGNTFFSGRLSDKETINDDRGFGRNDGFTLATFFYYAPTKWKGFGLGAGVSQAPLHNPDYDFPDEIIETGINMFYTVYKIINK